MTTARNSSNKIVMNGWIGLNEARTPAHLRPGDLAGIKNMNIEDGIALSSRLGQTSEHDRVYYGNLSPVRRILRYKSVSGVKKRLVLFGNDLRVDTNDNGKYDYVCTIPGTPWLLQFYDVVLFGSEQSDVGVYDPINGGVSYPKMRGHRLYFEDATTVAATGSGGYLEDAWYGYRFTYDIEVGGVFLGETGGVGTPTSFDGIRYTSVSVDFTAETGDDNKFDLKRGGDSFVNEIPSYATRINVYRTPPLTADPFSLGGSKRTDRYDLLWIGYIEVAALRNAAVGAVVFSDLGDLTPGKQIPVPPITSPPGSKRVAMHKGRLWFSSPHIDGAYYPDLVGFTHFGANGTEPFVFYPENTIPVGAGEPDEMTVIKSIHNSVLGVMKEDRTYAVLGGDDDVVEGVPNLSVQLIDGNTGCDAPDSVAEVEGGAIMFKSERGVMIWDGPAPRPVNHPAIKKTFDKIPGNRKRYSVGAYNPRRRWYDLYCTVPGYNEAGASTYNRHYLRFDFNNNTWVSGRLQRGVSAACTVNDADAEAHVLLGIDDVPSISVFASTPWVMRSDNSYREGIIGSSGVAFEADFGYQDGGYPWMRKKWDSIKVECETLVPLDLKIWVDNKGPYSPAAIPVPSADSDALIWDVGNWDEKKWGESAFGVSERNLTRSSASLDTLPRGNSIRCVLSGLNPYEPVRIHSVSIYYAPEES